MFDFCDIEITRDGDNRSAPCFIPVSQNPSFFNMGVGAKEKVPEFLVARHLLLVMRYVSFRKQRRMLF